MSRRKYSPGPVRTCIGCRAKTEKQALVRVVWDPRLRQFVASDTAPGRGAYVHRDAACIAEAQRRRSLARALRLGDAPTVAWTDLVDDPTRARL